MDLMDVKSHWKPEVLLRQEGIFFLKDIIKILEMETSKVKKKANEIRSRGKDPWGIMGARKIWNHWIIRMKIFAPFYKRHLIPKIKKLPPNMNGNTLLQQTGVYFLTDVCRYIPFSAHQIRYQAKRHLDSKKEIGVWKDEQLNCFVIDMPVFSPWIKSLWTGGFPRK